MYLVSLPHTPVRFHPVRTYLGSQQRASQCPRGSVRKRKCFIEISSNGGAAVMDTPKRKRRNKRKGCKLSEQEKAARRAARENKLKGAKMRTPEELSQAIGIGLNQAYAALAQGEIRGAVRLNQRWLIPDRVIERILNGEQPLSAA